MTGFESCFHREPHLLLEGALGERLKRQYRIPFDPHIDMGGLVRREEARKALAELWGGYAAIAFENHLPFLATTPTRRTNRARLGRTPFRDSILHENVAFLRRVRENQRGEMYIGGLVGCYGDAYTGEGALSYGEAAQFHRWEADRFAQEDVDFLLAGLMPTAPEAAGMAAALSSTGIPYIISFTIQRNGCLADGTPLSDAIEEIDGRVENQPLCYMTNCVHPTILKAALLQECNQNAVVKRRFSGIQANTSKRDYSELDGAADLYTAEPEELAEDMRAVNRIQPMKILGGCCGTDDRHLRAIARAFRP